MLIPDDPLLCDLTQDTTSKWYPQLQTYDHGLLEAGRALKSYIWSHSEQKKKWGRQTTLPTLKDASKICNRWLLVDTPNKFAPQINTHIENRHRNNRKAKCARWISLGSILFWTSGPQAGYVWYQHRNKSDGPLCLLLNWFWTAFF